ncbi:MAG: homoserine dehydrogenase [Clostridiaceae bacterium]|jgi:homoserine dehydrogenase|nr:homoserine dehydrogenase [Clostridiaceae bacterium]
MNIAILGFGRVGQGIYRILMEDQAGMEREAGQAIRIKKILVRQPDKDRGLPLASLPLTSDLDEILQDDSIQMVFEVMSEGEAGLHAIRQFLEKGKHVISANKAAIASDFFGIQEAARRGNCHFRFEAAVAGGIPLIDPLAKLRRLNVISQIRGILNTSTNFILSGLNEGRAKDDVMALARRLGTLEEDPTDDLEGYDARRKLAILTAMVLAREIDERQIPCLGINDLAAEDFAWAASQNRQVKLIACLDRKPDSFSLSVLPTALPLSDRLGETPGQMNRVEIRGDRIGLLSFMGKGGGMYPTAHAIWSDFFDVLGSKALYYDQEVSDLQDLSLDREGLFYVRPAHEGEGQLVRMSLAQALTSHDQGHVIMELA